MYKPDDVTLDTIVSTMSTSRNEIACPRTFTSFAISSIIHRKVIHMLRANS